MFLCLLHLTRLFNDQLIKVTLIKGIVQPLSCYLQSGTPKMSKHWLQEKQNMTVFVFQIVHSYCLYGNMTLKRNIYISGKGCPIARPFYGYGSKSINIDSIGYTMANISWSSLIEVELHCEIKGTFSIHPQEKLNFNFRHLLTPSYFLF